MKRKIPETSIAAYKSLEIEELRDTYKVIIKALGVLGEATSEEIAAYIRWPHAKIWKRLSELHRMELIYRPGNKRLLKSGRNGFTWRLTNPIKTDKMLQQGGRSFTNKKKDCVTQSCTATELPFFYPSQTH